MMLCILAYLPGNFIQGFLCASYLSPQMSCSMNFAKTVQEVYIEYSVETGLRRIINILVVFYTMLLIALYYRIYTVNSEKIQ